MNTTRHRAGQYSPAQRTHDDSCPFQPEDSKDTETIVVTKSVSMETGRQSSPCKMLQLPSFRRQEPKNANHLTSPHLSNVARVFLFSR